MAARPGSKSEGKVAIIGSGFIGRSWSVLFARAGYQPCLYDIEEKQLKTAEENIQTWLKCMQDDGLLKGQDAEDVMKRITFCADLQATLKDSVYMQECVFEDVDLKRKVFTEVDKYADDTTLLVSSTSCIDPAKFTSDLKHKENCIVAHPVNPPHLVPLVEVIPAPYTSPEVISSTFEILKKIGQTPVLVKKAVNGFILNRLQYALTMEAWRLFEDGVASPEDIDKVMTDGLGLRYSLMGPFETIHLNANGIEDYCKRYGDNIVKICEEQAGPRPLSGKTLEEAKKIMEERIPLEQIEERRKLRDRRLVALAKHRENADKSGDGNFSRSAKVPKMDPSLSKGKVAIVGSGFIGRSWTVLFARAGYKVSMFDKSQEQMVAAKENISTWLASLEEDGLLFGQRAGQVMERVSFHDSLEEVITGCMYVQECVFEDVDVKRSVFEEIDKYAGDSTLLISSSSCIDPTKFTSDLKHRENCIVAHPYNPPHLVPLVEVIPAPYTAPGALDQLLDIQVQIGQVPMVVRKIINGFAACRLQYAVIMEAWRLFEDGVASPEDIDKVMTDGLGLRYSLMGPFETIHLNANGIEDYCKRYGENIFKICEEQASPRPLSGKTLEEAKKIMEERIPLEQIEERRKLRDRRLALVCQLRQSDNYP